jgi:hypothetical protein
MSNTRTHASQYRNVKATHRRAQARRKGWAILVGFFCMLAVLILLAVTTVITTPWSSKTPTVTEKQTDDPQSERIGSIVRESDRDRCAIMKFDNDSGRVVDNIERCEGAAVLDTHNVPAPSGTVHRLDAISKSFSGNQR